MLRSTSHLSCCAAPTFPIRFDALPLAIASASPLHTEGWYAVLQTSSIKCYADVRVNNYVLGSGPSNLTVLVLNRNFGLDYPEHVLEEVRRDLERVVLEGGEINSVVSVPDGGIEGREMILFVGPTIDASAEAWEVFITWSVERQNGGTVVAVHPFRGVWRAYSDNYETYRSQLEIELPAFTQAVTTANRNASPSTRPHRRRRALALAGH